MREIKFKALAIDSKGNSEWFYYGVSQRPNIPIKYPFVKASDLQYTGINDKNDVEIYEGDIVKGTRLAGKGEFKRYIGKVVYRGCSFQIDGVGQYQRIDCEELHRAFEVIGNVYTHPHLLGSEKE